jgi:16S rRNA processing protein RimM
VTGSGSREWVEIGRVERTRGLDGSLVVRLHADDPRNLLGAGEVALQGGPGRIPFRVVAARVLAATDRGGTRVELRLAGLGTRELAREWSGARVSIRGAELQPLAAGEYYQRDLIGLAVRIPDGRSIGRVREVWPTAGHDLLVVETAGDPVLVPALEPVLTRVDLGAGEIWIDPPEGLIPAVLLQEPAGDSRAGHRS